MFFFSTIQWPKRTRTSAEMSQTIKRLLLNKTPGAIVRSNEGVHPSPMNVTIPSSFLASNASLPHSSPSASFVPLHQPQKHQKETVSNPADDVILGNITNFSINPVRDSEHNSTTTTNATAENGTNDLADNHKLHQSLLSTLSPNTCPPIPPNLGKNIFPKTLFLSSLYIIPQFSRGSSYRPHNRPTNGHPRATLCGQTPPRRMVSTQRVCSPWSSSHRDSIPRSSHSFARLTGQPASDADAPANRIRYFSDRTIGRGIVQSGGSDEHRFRRSAATGRLGLFHIPRYRSSAAGRSESVYVSGSAQAYVGGRGQAGI